MSVLTGVDLDSERKSIYNRYKRGWVREKMIELNRFSERTGYDWRCLRSADCKDIFGPPGHERCTNCLGIL